MAFGFTDILELFGALGVFLFGMKVMSDALLALAGNKMRSILASMTSNRVFGVFTGFLITSIIQSSSATTLMVVSFSNAGLITLTQSIGVIMGANIGTTVTAWLITFLGFKISISAVALPLVGLGFGLTFVKSGNYKNTGNFIVGFALLFIGLQFLKDAMPNIDNHPQLLSFLSNYTHHGFLSVLLFLCIGSVLTVVMQSSSATMALTLVFTAQGWIPFELAAAMVLGENIGTTVTANLASIVGNFQAKQTARAHLIFNLIGVLWVLILFYPFLDLVSNLSVYLGSDSPYLNAAAIPVSISLFHSVFNAANTFLLIWFVKPLAKLVTWFVPSIETETPALAVPKFLSKSILDYPETAINALLNESKFLYENTIFEIVSHALNIHRTDIISTQKLKKVIKKSNVFLNADVNELYTSRVKTIYGDIIKYATKAQSAMQLTEQQNVKIAGIKIANRKMVEIIKAINELSRNINKYLNSENKYIKKEYDKLRDSVARVLRLIYELRNEKTAEENFKSLQDLKQNLKTREHLGSTTMDELIRQDLINSDMASSLFNDHDNVNDIINNLIDVAYLLYGQKDILLENPKM